MAIQGDSQIYISSPEKVFSLLRDEPDKNKLADLAVTDGDPGVCVERKKRTELEKDTHIDTESTPMPGYCPERRGRLMRNALIEERKCN